MSWLFSQALVEEFSAATCSDGEPSAQLNVMPTPQPFWRQDKTIEFSSPSRFGLTCAPLTASRGEALLTWFREGSRARTSAPLARVKAWMASVLASGEKWRGWWARFDPASSSWRTPQCSLLEDWESYSETWPRSGLMLDGKCYPLPNAAPCTSANESGLWPTPTVCGNYNRPGASATSGMGLASAVRLYPTPTGGGKSATSCLGDWGGSHAREVMRQLVPPEELFGPLNPQWVEWLMGWPIGWTDLKPLETGKFLEWRQQHGAS